jgi:hypothetical protein
MVNSEGSPAFRVYPSCGGEVGQTCPTTPSQSAYDSDKVIPAIYEQRHRGAMKARGVPLALRLPGEAGVKEESVGARLAVRVGECPVRKPGVTLAPKASHTILAR